ncbi:hypothetical protein DFH09DRAFT_1294094 [Mycena vulgaris]|nr:hypothetical protein DFH09DRAFT_1294094 [Mycena vulgaris]
MVEVESNWILHSGTKKRKLAVRRLDIWLLRLLEADGRSRLGSGSWDRRAQPRCWMDREINAGTIGASSLVRDPGHGLQPSPQLRRRAQYEIAWMYPIEPGGTTGTVYLDTDTAQRSRSGPRARDPYIDDRGIELRRQIFDLDRAEADHDAVLELGSGIEDVEVPYPRRDLHAGAEAVSFLQHLDLAELTLAAGSRDQDAIPSYSKILPMALSSSPQRRPRVQYEIAWTDPDRAEAVGEGSRSRRGAGSSDAKSAMQRRRRGGALAPALAPAGARRGAGS